MQCSDCVIRMICIFSLKAFITSTWLQLEFSTYLLFLQFIIPGEDTFDTTEVEVVVEIDCRNSTPNQINGKRDKAADIVNVISESRIK